MVSKKIICLLLIVAVVLVASGCINSENQPQNPQTTTINNFRYIATVDNIELYEIRISSENATCIYGTNRAGTATAVAVLDCKYDSDGD